MDSPPRRLPIRCARSLSVALPYMALIRLLVQEAAYSPSARARRPMSSFRESVWFRHTTMPSLVSSLVFLCQFVLKLCAADMREQDGRREVVLVNPWREMPRGTSDEWTAGLRQALDSVSGAY